VGAVFLPIGLFGFAWTCQKSVHWSACIILSAPFGFGMVLVFLSVFVSTRPVPVDRSLRAED
jgi:hypothetical protein